MVGYSYFQRICRIFTFFGVRPLLPVRKSKPLILLPAYAHAIVTTALLVSAVVGALLVVTRRLHSRYSADPFEGAQKLHHELTPRVGGLAIYMGVLAACWVARGLGLPVAGHLALLLLAGIPAWSLGMAEDITKRVRPRWRMLATMVSGVIASLISGVSITQLGVVGVDALLQVAPLSILFTAFAVGGVANAVNLIDGMNGLASGFACVAFGALGVIALSEGDAPMALYCMVLGAASLGFMLLNWPRGRIFLGDGGSYFLGFALAWACIQMTQRHPYVAPFSVLTVCIHPVFEALYSIWRRNIRGQSYARADRLHLHSLVLRRVVRNPSSTLNRSLSAVRAGWDLSHTADWVSNAAGGLLVASLSLPAAVAAFFTHHHQLQALLACLVFALGYVALYARLVRFKWCSPIHFLLQRPAEPVLRLRRLRRA